MTSSSPISSPITIRRATETDRAAIRRLAQLDSRPAPEGDALLAFAGTELRAALQADGARAVADPFAPTAELLELLHARAAYARNGMRQRRSGALRALLPRLV
jgi:hypothetical protein